jgi:hypothetical protein
MNKLSETNKKQIVMFLAIIFFPAAVILAFHWNLDTIRVFFDAFLVFLAVVFLFVFFNDIILNTLIIPNLRFFL